ncbi:hypothetical protein F2Q69_00003454 [Brassica cretica]|uniref:Uncharacterized protein n=1 Tax=Brassica cretica TaxID=69181 RepID=A0A8S9PB16_BRACR|nr:hypothetical protein F2Q69_00003454 [Brassica cretica]
MISKREVLTYLYRSTGDTNGALKIVGDGFNCNKNEVIAPSVSTSERNSGVAAGRKERRYAVLYHYSEPNMDQTEKAHHGTR